MREGCSHSARELLDFHVNGTLSAAEDEIVIAHLADCDECTRELTALEEMAAGLATRGKEVLAYRRRGAWSLGVASAVGVGAMVAVVLWMSPAERTGKPRTLEVDLGAGAARGDAVPQISVSGSTGAVDLVVTLVPEAGATYHARIDGPDGSTRFGPVPVEWDEFVARVRQVPVTVLQPQGEYRLRVRELLTSQAPRWYEYVFHVERAP